MQNFYFNFATRIHFGRSVLYELTDEILKYGDKIFFVYGENSAKRNGAYDLIHALCEEKGIQVIDFTGIEPNPRHTTVDKAISLIKVEKPDCIVAMGGGSIIDSAKAMSFGAYHDGSCWDFYEGKAKAKQALPLITIPTIAASGAEVSNVSVIVNMEEQRKSHYRHDIMRPAAVFSDPSYTFSVPAFQTACGVIDAMSHIYEGYFSHSSGSVQDGMSEGIQKACIEHGLRVMKNPYNYESRAQLLWAAQLTITHLADNGRIFIGAIHALESALSGYLGLTHGAGIGICTLAWLKYALNEQTAYRIAGWGRNVWAICGESNDMETAKKAIEHFENFLIKLNLPLTLSDLKGDIDQQILRKAAHLVFLSNDTTQWFRPLLTEEEVFNVMKIAYKQ